MKNEAIILHELKVGYGKRVVASITDARLFRGNLVALVGRNGAGKSTLLRTIAGLQSSIAGEVLIDGLQLGSFPQQELSRRVSVVLAGSGETANLSVREVVALGRMPYTGFFGTLSNADASIVETSMQQVGISGLADKLFTALSDGERQKVLIAKALAQQTPIMLLDEPTAFLDFSSKVELLQLLHSLAKDEEKAILITTHDISLALKLADEVWLLDENDVLTHPDQQQLQSFIGDEAAKYL